MKKYRIYKLISISVIVTILLSFLIPSTSFDSYGKITKGNISPVGIIDTFSNSITSLSVFITAFIYILCIGVFYGVLVKTGKYEALVNNTAYKFRNKKGAFAILSILMFGIMGAVTGNSLTMLMFIPAFIGVFKKLGYNNFTAIISTIGATLLGCAGALNTSGANQILSSTVSDNVVFKILIALILLIAVIVFVLVFNKPEEVKLEKQEEKTTHLGVIFDIILVVLILGMIPWETYFGFDSFTKFNESLLDAKVLGVSIYKAFIASTLAPFGSFTLFDLSVLMLVMTAVVIIINRMKIDDIMQTVAISLKRSLPYALIAVFVNTVLVNVYSTGIFYTVAVSLAEMTDKLFSGVLLSGVAALSFPDYTYGVQFSLSTVTAVLKDQKFLVLLAVIYQAIYSLVLLVSPTSLLVLLGLQYTNESYKDWFKYIVKFFLVSLIITFIVLMILASNFITIASIMFFVIIVLITLFTFIIAVLNKKSTANVKKVIKEEKKEEVKEETEKVATKKAADKKTTTKKTTTKKSTVKKTK